MTMMRTLIMNDDVVNGDANLDVTLVSGCGPVNQPTHT